MKVCERCRDEISTKDGENLCQLCERNEVELSRRVRRIAKAKARARCREKDDVLRSLGLVKVRGALGGTYWE